jgi:hypothetical protein
LSSAIHDHHLSTQQGGVLDHPLLEIVAFAKAGFLERHPT